MQWVTCWFYFRSKQVLAGVCLLMDFDRHEYHFCSRVSFHSFLLFTPFIVFSLPRFPFRIVHLFTFFPSNCRSECVLCFMSLNNRSLLQFHKLTIFTFFFHLKNDLSVYYPLHLLLSAPRESVEQNFDSVLGAVSGEISALVKTLEKAFSIQRADHAWKGIICNWNIFSSLLHTFNSIHVI